tara:strand:+ start:9103 stop:9543 length:441 start_codon:yes stop_codon:yes gene_type:complete
MKDKLIAFSTIGLIFGLFFYYKVVNPVDNVADNKNPKIENVIIDINEDEIINSINEDISIIFKDDDSNRDSECNLLENETDILDFSSAFKYYRTCNNSGDNFTWKGNSYSTLLKAEDKVNTFSNNIKSVDKVHLKLQNQLIGMDVK